MKCVLTGIELHKKCPVKTCMYNSKIAKTGCFAEKIETCSLEELAEHKGLENQITKVFRTRKRAVNRIHCVLLLDEFFQFTKNKPVPLAVYEGINDFLLSLDGSVFSIAELEWNFEKLAKVMYQPYWEEFFTKTGATQQSIQNLLDLSNKEFSALLTFFKE